MAELTSGGPAGLSREQEEAAFYHEAALNAAWTGSRLMIGIVTAGLGAFIFSFFYLRSLNSYGLWYPSGFKGPQQWTGATVMIMVVLSAVLNSAGLRQIKAGRKNTWSGAATVALALGVLAAVLQIWQLTALPFQPAASGFASVFVGTQPALIALFLGSMIWLETLVMRVRRIPDISFVEQPPTFEAAAEVQRFQASLSSFTLFWNFIALAALVMWVLFYLVH